MLTDAGVFRGSTPSPRRITSIASRLIRAASEDSPCAYDSEAKLLPDADACGCPAPNTRRGTFSALRLIRESSPSSWSTETNMLADANVLGGSAPSTRHSTSSVAQLIRAASQNSPCAYDPGARLLADANVCVDALRRGLAAAPLASRG